MSNWIFWWRGQSKGGIWHFCSWITKNNIQLLMMRGIILTFSVWGWPVDLDSTTYAQIFPKVFQILLAGLFNWFVRHNSKIFSLQFITITITMINNIKKFSWFSHSLPSPSPVQPTQRLQSPMRGLVLNLLFCFFFWFSCSFLLDIYWIAYERSFHNFLFQTLSKLVTYQWVFSCRIDPL